jgi:hypothetical protein
MKLVKTEAEIDVYGEVVKLTLPSLAMWEKYQDAIREGKVTEFKATEDFLADCGFPKEMYKQLELGHISDIVNMLSGIKKK